MTAAVKTLRLTTPNNQHQPRGTAPRTLFVYSLFPAPVLLPVGKPWTHCPHTRALREAHQCLACQQPSITVHTHSHPQGGATQLSFETNSKPLEEDREST